jgi:SAM-dependent methyltransferase
VTVAPECPACRGREHERLGQIPIASQHRDYAPGDEALQARLTAAAATASSCYEMLRCRICGMEFADPMAAPPAGWYALAYRALDLYPPARWEHGVTLASFRASDAVVEFGCGSGSFLAGCRERGLDSVGLDFSADAVEQCRRQGLPARRFDLRDELPPDLRGRGAQLVAFHVVEHLEEPALLFRHARAAAAAGARLWIGVPSDRRPSRRFGERDFLDEPPHHMSRWTEAAFREIGWREGWRLQEMHYEPLGYRASLWSIATHSAAYVAARGRSVAPSAVERLLRWRLYPQAALRRFRMRPPLSGFSMLARFVREGSGE